LKKEYGIEIIWKVFPLHPEVPEDGIELTRLFAGMEARIKAMQARLQQAAVAEGLTLAERSRTYNSRRAQELGKWAETKGKGEIYHIAVYRAFFADGKNIALIDELVEIAAEIGLSADEAKEVLEAGSFSASVDADWERAALLEITAVPAHIYGSRRLSGFAPYEDFVKLIGK
jgi:predicted DsbA family dithiol-disulfide isomerase